MKNNPIKVFLDANILFSISYKSESGLNQLFNLKNIQYFSCDYAVGEARRNLDKPDQHQRLEQVLTKITITKTVLNLDLEEKIDLRDKDLPILFSAISAGCEYLITGDLRDFGKFFGKQVLGVKVLPPRIFLEEAKIS
jgi:predicted nucleic acid-binding protein